MNRLEIEFKSLDKGVTTDENVQNQLIKDKEKLVILYYKEIIDYDGEFIEELSSFCIWFKTLTIFDFRLKQINLVKYL